MEYQAFCAEEIRLVANILNHQCWDEKGLAWTRVPGSPRSETAVLNRLIKAEIIEKVKTHPGYGYKVTHDGMKHPGVVDGSVTVWLSDRAKQFVAKAQL